MRFTLKNPRSLQYIDYQNVRKTEFLGCQSQDGLKPFAWAADIFPDAPDKVLRSDDNSESRAFKALISTFSPASTLILSPRQRSQIASYLSNALSKQSFCGEAAAGRQSPATKARHKRICPRRFRIGFI